MTTMHALDPRHVRAWSRFAVDPTAPLPPPFPGTLCGREGFVSTGPTCLPCLHLLWALTETTGHPAGSTTPAPERRSTATVTETLTLRYAPDHDRWTPEAAASLIGQRPHILREPGDWSTTVGRAEVVHAWADLDGALYLTFEVAGERADVLREPVLASADAYSLPTMGFQVDRAHFLGESTRALDSVRLHEVGRRTVLPPAEPLLADPLLAGSTGPALPVLAEEGTHHLVPSDAADEGRRQGNGAIVACGAFLPTERLHGGPGAHTTHCTACLVAVGVLPNAHGSLAVEVDPEDGRVLGVHDATEERDEAPLCCAPAETVVTNLHVTASTPEDLEEALTDVLDQIVGRAMHPSNGPRITPERADALRWEGRRQEREDVLALLGEEYAHTADLRDQSDGGSQSRVILNAVAGNFDRVHAAIRDGKHVTEPAPEDEPVNGSSCGDWCCAPPAPPVDEAPADCDARERINAQLSQLRVQERAQRAAENGVTLPLTEVTPPRVQVDQDAAEEERERWDDERERWSVGGYTFDPEVECKPRRRRWWLLGLA